VAGRGGCFFFCVQQIFCGSGLLYIADLTYSCLLLLRREEEGFFLLVDRFLLKKTKKKKKKKQQQPR
jgi:hypothetical protein